MSKLPSSEQKFDQKTPPNLTPTEIALLDNLSTGKTNSQLAELHGISVNTVKFHLNNIFDKFGIRNRKQAIRYYESFKG